MSARGDRVRGHVLAIIREWLEADGHGEREEIAEAVATLQSGGHVRETLAEMADRALAEATE